MDNLDHILILNEVAGDPDEIPLNQLGVPVTLENHHRRVARMARLVKYLRDSLSEDDKEMIQECLENAQRALVDREEKARHAQRRWDALSPLARATILSRKRNGAHPIPWNFAKDLPQETVVKVAETINGWMNARPSMEDTRQLDYRATNFRKAM